MNPGGAISPPGYYQQQRRSMKRKQLEAIIKKTLKPLLKKSGEDVKEQNMIQSRLFMDAWHKRRLEQIRRKNG